MITIESHLPHSTVTTLTIDLAELPKRNLARRVALAFSLVLITSVDPRPRPIPTQQRGLERLARAERERLAERLLLSTIPRR